MTSTKQPPVCKTPELCAIACPYNRILAELGKLSCEMPVPLPEGEDNPIEIVFGNTPAADDLSSRAR